MIYSESGVLDELFFHHAPMRRAGEASSEVTLQHEITARSGGGLILPGPLMLVNCPALEQSSVWMNSCAIMHQQQIAVFAPHEKMAGVQEGSTPMRIAQTFAGEPIDLEDIVTADAIVVNCWQRKTRNSRWPSEADARQLGSYLDAIRVASGGSVPVGVGFQVGVCEQDVASAIDAGVDFISVVSDERFVSIQHVVALRKVRAACLRAGLQDFVVLATLPAVTAEEMLKLVAVGASMVSVDAMLAPYVPAITDVGPRSSGLESALLHALEPQDGPVEIAMQRVAQELGNCTERLIDRMAEIGVNSLASLTEKNLRTSSTTLSKLLGIEML